jgi:hypothetical protein
VNQQQQQPRPEPVQLVITMQPDGQIQLTGPIGNEIFCLGLLAKAQQIIAEHSRAVTQQQQQQGIVPADASLLNMLRNGRN